MRSLEASRTRIVLVVRDDGVLAGTVTDGDIRRALLAGHGLDSPLAPIANRTFASVGPEATRAEVLDLMQARRVEQLPILDAGGRLVGLHLLHEVLGAVERPNWAVIMAGGRGTRLLPLTENVPKPMLKVAGRPILERIVLHLVGFGIRRIFISVNYLSDVIEEHFGDGSKWGCRIDYLREERPLGTGGSLSLLPEPPAVPLLALNGDLVVQFDVARMLAFHAEGSFKSTVAVHDYTHTVPFGVLDIAEGQVRDLKEKPTFVWPTNAGIYVLEPEVVARVPPDTEFPLPGLLEQCLQRGERVGAFRLDGDWIDVGRVGELRRARGHL
jgi:dTDP-glucose pyrophosphorylase